MSQRWIAFAVAAPSAFLLILLAAFVPLPYAAYSPGPTFDILGTDADDTEIIQVEGHRAYRDDGEIRFTTVQTTRYGKKLTLLEAMADWFDPTRAVIPYEIAHPEDTTQEEERRQGAVSMVGSQDNAIKVAMEALGYDVPAVMQVADVDRDGPSYKKLRVRDKILEVDGEPIGLNVDKLIAAVQQHGPGDPVELTIQRGTKTMDVAIEPEQVDGDMRIGITPGVGYDFPFEVTIEVDPDIGGPSAGLMFSLAVYDTLTPGSLTDGATIAGTGEITPAGKVGPIGGIQQKIAGAEDAGAKLFFVPPANCDDVTGLDPDLRLVKATTMESAKDSLEAWTSDPDADLPTCGSAT